jgi:hypothetical protein
MRHENERKEAIMRALVTGVLLLVLVVAAGAGERGKYVIPVRDQVKAYANEVRRIYEKSVFTVGVEDRLVVLREERRALKVRDPEGRVGWVQREDVKTVARSALFTYGEAEIPGYLDSPTPIYILEGTDPGETGILLDRSFKDDLTENVDRETVERSTKRM